MTHRDWWIIQGLPQKYCTRSTDKQHLKQAIVLFERALIAGGSCRAWMEDVVKFIAKARHVK